MGVEMGALQFVNESASAKLDFLSIDMGMVSSVYSLMRRMGDATGLMRQICEYADKNDMQLILYVGSYVEEGDEWRDDGMTNEQLISWYEKFDFQLNLIDPDVNMHPMMTRQPLKERLKAWVYPEDSLPEGARL